MNVFINGLLTGLLLQFAIGPVFFYITNLTLQKSFLDGFAGVIAVTLVDYLYITLAILGIGKLLERNKIKKIFAIISSIVLIIFGLIMIRNIITLNHLMNPQVSTTNPIASFTSAFLLNISSPMTIIFFTSLFATKVVEYNYGKKELFIFGLSTGLATILFMGTSVIIFSFLRQTIPIYIIKILNIFVGLLLIGYGSIRVIKIIHNKI